MKLVLVALWLAANFACGSQNQNNVKSTNIANIPASNTPAKTDKKAPKEVCAYLPEFPTGEYKLVTDPIYSCEFEKEEKLSGGKKRVWSYKASGAAGYIKYVELHLVATGTVAENLQAEKRFVEATGTLWQKAFAVPLPNNIKEELLVNKGKVVTSYKKFTEPVYVTITHSARGDVYGLKIEIDLCNLCK